MGMDYDVAIVGGGMAGFTIAAQLPVGLKVCLLESEGDFGYHSTGRSAALFSTTYGPADIRRMSRASKAFFDAPPPGFCEVPLVRDRGAMMVAAPGEEDALAGLAAEIGLDEENYLVDPDQAASISPWLRADRIVGALFESQAKDIDVDALFQGYRRKAKANGVELRSKCEILAARQEECGWRVEVAGADKSLSAQLTARVLVNAAGAWGDVVAKRCGVEPVGLVPKRRSAGMVKVGPDGHSMQTPMLIGLGDDWYMKPEGQQMLVSPSDATPVEPHDAYADDFALAQAVDRAQHLTRLEVRRFERTWGGLRTFAPDGNPVKGWADGVPGFYWSVGQGGYGIQTAPAWGAEAAAEISAWL